MGGKVAKLFFNTDNRARERFTRMAVYVNLDKPLIFQVLINGALQRIEYEYLPVVCFSCRRYSHAKEVFPKSVPCSKAYNKVLSSGDKVSSDDSMMVEDDIAEGLKLMDHR
uniref:DUF4283 domain-containing protein n=1 Tax=Gossypium raimondii TaxID=29730 RepID=A0A0D2PDQ3_GOSRA|nr:hypothetical protein B456_007G227100 [Gossypium raimondii]